MLATQRPIRLPMPPVYRQRDIPEQNPQRAKDVPIWVLIVGGVVLAVVSTAAGAKISEVVLTHFLPQVFR